ncbi:hypothetical protein LJC56_05610 [Christensenellaceae bacterium OttesenSCG-928-K19]|nr:hypothetical protein [Christensenellaceae bacterium OttesenSCG-928-K19]
MLYTKEGSILKCSRKWGGGDFWPCTCAVCGDKSYYKYCSQRCANDAAIARRKAKANAKRLEHTKCSVCEKPIEQNLKNKIRKYCSNACKQKAYRLKKNTSGFLDSEKIDRHSK